MTKETFLEQVRKNAKNYKWNITDGKIRCTGEHGLQLCLITLVNFLQNKRNYICSDYRRAANDLDLNNADMIACAADNLPNHNKELRKELLLAIGKK